MLLLHSIELDRLHLPSSMFQDLHYPAHRHGNTNLFRLNQKDVQVPEHYYQIFVFRPNLVYLKQNQELF
jgi:hypothetical protein